MQQTLQNFKSPLKESTQTNSQITIQPIKQSAFNSNSITMLKNLTTLSSMAQIPIRSQKQNHPSKRNPKQLNLTCQETILKQSEIQINLNRTKDSLDSSTNKLKLWSSLDNGSSHSVGRKENKRYQEEDVNNDMMDESEKEDLKIIVHHQTENSLRGTVIASQSTMERTVIIDASTANNSYGGATVSTMNNSNQNANNHKQIFKDYLSQSDIQQNTQPYALSTKGYQTSNQQQYGLSNNPNVLYEQRDIKTPLANVNLINQIQRPQTNLCQNTISSKKKPSMFSMRLRPESSNDQTHLDHHQRGPSTSLYSSTSNYYNSNLKSNSVLKIKEVSENSVNQMTPHSAQISCKNVKSQKFGGFSFLGSTKATSNGITQQAHKQTRNVNNDSKIEYYGGGQGSNHKASAINDRSKSRQNLSKRVLSACEEIIEINNRLMGSKHSVSGSSKPKSLSKDKHYTSKFDSRQNKENLKFKKASLKGSFLENSTVMSNFQRQQQMTRPLTSLNKTQLTISKINTTTINANKDSRLKLADLVSMPSTTKNLSTYRSNNKQKTSQFNQFNLQESTITNNGKQNTLQQKPQRQQENIVRPQTQLQNDPSKQQICLGLVYLVSSKVFLKIQLQRQQDLRYAFQSIQTIQQAIYDSNSDVNDILDHTNQSYDEDGNVMQPSTRLRMPINNYNTGLNRFADNTIVEVDDEREELDQSMNNRSTLALIEKLQGDAQLRQKLDKVINILSSIKHDFN